MTFSDNQRQLLWWLWLAAVCLVSLGSLLPGSSPPIQMLRGVSDTLLHFLAYAVLGLLPVLWARRRRTAMAVLFSMAVLGWALECGQTLVPGRSFDLMDLAGDVAGIVCGALIGLLVSR